MKLFFLLAGSVGLLAIIFLFLSGRLSLPFSTTPHPVTPVSDTQHAAGEAIPKRTRTPEERAKDKASTIKQSQLKEQPVRMRVGLQNSAWMVLSDEQGRRQGYDATKLFDEIPVAFQPPQNMPVGPAASKKVFVQEYVFTDTVPLTATIYGQEEGTYKFWQWAGHHMLNVEKVPIRKDIKDTIHYNAQENFLSIHFDPAFPERRGRFQLRDSINYKKSMGKNVAFNGKELPVIPGATLTFTDDIDALFSGKNGITITLDRNSDGQAEHSVQVGGGQLTAEDSRQVDFTPESPEFAELFGAETANQAKE